MKETYKAEAGENIHRAATKAILLAKSQNAALNLVFNELNIQVHPESYVLDIVEKYLLLAEMRRHSL